MKRLALSALLLFVHWLAISLVRLRRVLFGAALALVAIGCARHALLVDPAFSAPDQKDLRSAAEAWNHYTKPSHRLTFDGRDWRVMSASTPTGDDGFTPYGYTDPKAKVVCIRPQHDGVTTYSIALHEFGHVLGLNHTDSGVMMARAVSDEFTADVILECRRVGACP